MYNHVIKIIEDNKDTVSINWKSNKKTMKM
jgi:hypothetical protein